MASLTGRYVRQRALRVVTDIALAAMMWGVETFWRLVPLAGTPDPGRCSLRQAMDEYARGVLADADRDPLLDQVLAEQALALRAEVEWEGPARRRTLRRFLTAHITAVLDHATDPRAEALPSQYAGYSPVMLQVAAACRLARSRGLVQP